ncbi:hypothetical protein CBR_g37375 [Chara braunii]|uniref:Reverse transcriptase domain-containing protein n=1 Tax=Chara braunii TaxID=69332 RepID=A0A388JZQ5_CHABU|nr:hypothetical protein CBR_g37375 [Chara braunii]|eukprot:GBG63289.1 hypothetical protein CBR_g37375 [Chara braunii]
MYIAQQEDIHNLNAAVQMHKRAFDQVNSCLQQLQQRPVTAPDASSSNTSDRLNALEIDFGALKDDVQLQQTATQQLEQQICTAAANPSPTPRESTPKFDDQGIFCDSTKTNPIPWFRKFELKLQLHQVVKHYSISRSCPALGNALTHVEDILTTTAELFDKAAQIIVTDKEAKNLNRSSAAGPSKDQHRPKVAVVVAAMPTDQSSAAVSANKGDRLAAARDGGRPGRGRGRGKPKTNTTFIPGPGAAALAPLTHYGLSEQAYKQRTRYRYCLWCNNDLHDRLPIWSRVLFVRKKNKDLRLCINYRKLNAETIKNAGPLPRIDPDFKSNLEKYFTPPIRSNDHYKFAFKTRYGHFEWVVMPFGLTNAPTTFQAAMANEFRAMLDRFVLVYLDDILVYSRILEDHLEHLRRVLETLRRAKYKANRDKCEFVRQELEYLGHFVTPEDINPLSDRIQAIQEWSEPRNVMDVRSFFGLASYYQRFIKGYSKIAAHLTKLQSEDRPFDFGEDAQESFLALKSALLFAKVLRIYDPLLPTCVTTNASGYGIGAILEQHNGVD